MIQATNRQRNIIITTKSAHLGLRGQITHPVMFFGARALLPGMGTSGTRFGQRLNEQEKINQ